MKQAMLLAVLFSGALLAVAAAQAVDDEQVQSDDWAWDAMDDMEQQYLNQHRVETKNGYKDIRQFNAGYDPASFDADGKDGGTKGGGKTTGTGTAACTKPPPQAPLNAAIKCSAYSGCVVRCDKKHRFPNGKATMRYECENNEWKVQGEDWDVLPACQPICIPKCQNEGICVAPNQCECKAGTSGPVCQFSEMPCLNLPPTPLNSQMSCTANQCRVKCMSGYRLPHIASDVTTTHCQGGIWKPKVAEWQTIPDCEPICEPACQNDGKCVSHNFCQCPKNFRGRQCQFGKERCDMKKIGFSGNVNCTYNWEQTSCQLSCPQGVPISYQPTENYVCYYETGVFTPDVVPKCLYGQKSVVTVNEGRSSGVKGSIGNAGSGGVKGGWAKLATPTPGSCLFWGGSHVKTFDGLLYSYSSECAYTLLKDSKDNTFTVNVKKGKCDSRLDCYLQLIIYIESTNYKLETNADGKIILTQNGEKSLQIPVQTSELTVQLVGPLVYIKVAPLGFSIKWDTKSMLLVDIEEHLWNKTDGLCSKHDGNAANDLKCRNGNYVTSLPVFLSTWESEFLGKHCTDAVSTDHPCTASALNSAATDFCSKLLTDPKFQLCRDHLNEEKYYEACRWDYCASGSNHGACETISIFATECKRKVPEFDRNWREENFCGMSCTGGAVYKQCGPAAQATCTSPSETHQAAEFCVEGCFCPEGTVRHHDTCVAKDQCPCQYKRRLFPNGKTISQKCNTCVCNGGQWSCTEAVCGARCSAIGDPHYTTFDGKSYDFMGKCNYYLLKSQHLTIEAENIQCSGSISEAMGLEAVLNPSCTKTVTIRADNSVIELKQHRELTVNGKEIARLPIKVGNIRVRRASSLFIIVDLPNDAHVWWDGVARVYVDVSVAYLNKTQGLCGTFTSNQKDDFLTPEGDVEQQVSAFANKWKVLETCPNVESNVGTHPCDAHPEKKAAAELICNRIKTGNFSECAWQVDAEPFYQNCLFDVCSCTNEPSSCFCPIFAAYGHECAANGVHLNWRPEVRECGVQCPAGLTFQACGDSCSHTCTDISVNRECVSQCVEGCNCPPGQTLDQRGECVAVGQCPCLHQGQEFPPGAHRLESTINDTFICQCVKAAWTCSPASDEDIKKHAKPESLKVECDASKHLEFTKCEPTNPATCKNLHVHRDSEPEVCKAGCRCKKGYVLDALSGNCVRATDCPCHHGGRSYPDGSKVQEKCNVCECEGGKWSCSSRACTGTCSTWGESHFQTFDGRLYDFQGLCSYALVQSRASAAESFELAVQSVVCGSGGVTCVRSLTLSVGADETYTLTKDVPLPHNTKFNRTTFREAGLFVVAEVFDLGLVVHWDKATRIYVHLDPKWKNRVRGLCGNFNDNEQDDFQTPSGGVSEASARVFGDSWRLQPQCLEASDPKDACVENPSRKAWAAEKCGVLKDTVFQPCHSEVPVEPYFDRCLQDTCACDLGGDCECLCTAISAYAQECTANGVPIRWRTQELCPIQCDETCSHYSPCVSTCPHETCDNFFRINGLTQLCKEETCVEGCELKKCGEGEIYQSLQELKCVPKSSCKPVCMKIGNVTYYEGDLMEQDACHSCHCSHNRKSCQGKPCTTTESTTLATTPMISHPSCVPGWSRWVNGRSPKEGSRFSDREPLDQANLPCGPEHAIGLKCRTVDGKQDSSLTGQNVTCDLNNGLQCQGTPENPCSDYEIQIRCDCNPTDIERSSSVQWCEDGWTEWFNTTHPESDAGDFEHFDTIKEEGRLICSTEQIKDIECRYFDEQAVAEGTKSVKGRTKKGQFRSYQEAKQMGHIVTCKKSYGLTCNNALQPDFLCHDYSMRVFCECQKPTTEMTTEPAPTTPQCPSGFEWRECLYECDQLCHSYENELRLQGVCSNATNCRPGCGKIGESCEFGQRWRSQEVCVNSDDCTCLSNDGTIVQPGGVRYENNNCSKCQCVDNNYKCHSVMCSQSENMVLSTTPESKEDLFKSTPKPCDVWSTWIDDHDARNDSFEKEGYSHLELRDQGFCNQGHIEKIECVTVASETDYRQTSNVNVRCDLHSGLTCYDDEQGLFGTCDDYKVRYFCSCQQTETTVVVTTEAIETTTSVIVTLSTLTPPHKCNANKYKNLIQGETPLKDSAFTASSILNRKYRADNARISPESKDAWIADEDNSEQYLQVDLGRPEPVYGVILQGNEPTHQFVTSYRVTYSLDGANFSPATDEYGVPKVFRGPADATSVEKQILPIPFEGRYVRINPVTWQNGVSLKLELIGCAEIMVTEPSDTTTFLECDEPMGVADGRLSSGRMSASSVLKGDSTKYGAHLARLGGPAAWRANRNLHDEWIIFDLGEPRELTGIATEGDAKSRTWVTTFVVQYSQNSHNWNQILNEQDEEKVFLANVDATNSIKNYFGRKIYARFVKVIPIKWNGGISMRIELFGCFQPYMTEAYEPTTTSPEVTSRFAECNPCPNLPQERLSGCSPCEGGLLWGGESCVEAVDCSCFVGHIEYPVGSRFQLEGCLECRCALGGATQCQPVVCAKCADGLRSILTPTCICVCQPCPQGELICPSSGACVPREQWCDGIDHCTDDEKNCTQTTVATTIATTLPPTCPPAPECEGELVKKTTEATGVKGTKRILRCPMYECLPPPNDYACSLEGKIIVTFDNSTLQAEVCDHILATEKGEWRVTVTKNCSYPSKCSNFFTVKQANYLITLNPDFSVEFNGHKFNIEQAKTIAARYREFEISRLGDRLYFESNHFGFLLVMDDQGSAQITVPHKLKGRVDGLCGHLSGIAFDDKTKPDGKLAKSTLEFVESWSVEGSQVECVEHTCPRNRQEKAIETCKKIKEKAASLADCGAVVDWSRFLTVCTEKTCECLEDGESSEQACLCKAAEHYVGQCRALKPHDLDISNWRIQLGCAAECPPGLIYHECYERRCEPSCANMQCPQVQNQNGGCNSGCFCPDGLVRKADACVKPSQCKDCVCNGFGDPQYLTFDRVNYTFNGNCSYVASRDVSSSGEHQFQVLVTNVECVDEPGTTCTEGVTILYQGHVVSVRRLEGHKKILTTLDGEPVVKFPLLTSWVTIEAIPKRQVTVHLTNLEVEVIYLYFNHAYVIRLPSHTFGNKTEGLCGNCNKDPADDLKRRDGVISGDTDEFGFSWLVKDLPKGILFEDNCEVKKLPECKPLPPDEDPCLAIMDEEKFGKCHQLVDPRSYVQACQYDVCHSKQRQRSACRDVEAYARECQQHGVCLDWRSQTLCPYGCTEGFEYRPCGPGCQPTCDTLNNNSRVCPVEPTEGCFCPKGQVLQGGRCVPEAHCRTCDSEGHYVGQTWHQDNCTVCTCEAPENSAPKVKCVEKTCAAPTVCSVGHNLEIVAGTENDCCPQQRCVKVACPNQTEPICGLNQVLKTLLQETNCPIYVCECIPREECPPLVDNSQQFMFVEEPVQVIPIGMVRRVNESGCCPHYDYVCQQESCPRQNCPEYYKTQVQPAPEGTCCPAHTCVPPKDACIFEPNFIAADQGGERNRTVDERTKELHAVSTTWQESPCRRCSCVAVSGGGVPIVECHLATCPSINRNSIYEEALVLIRGQCCPEIKRTACKAAGNIYKEGEKWNLPGEPCKVHECRAENSVLLHSTTTLACNRTCDFGYEYLAPGDDVCCGKCVQVACVVDGTAYESGDTWKSADKCTTFECQRSGDSLQVAASSITCQSIEGCPTEQVQTSADGCCQFCQVPPQNQTLVNNACASEELIEEETIALVTEFNGSHGKCLNTEPIRGFKVCAGSCPSRTRYNAYDALTQVSECKCCQGLEYEVVEVGLTCEDDHKYKKSVRFPSECECSACSAGGDSHQTKKTNPNSRGPKKFLDDIPAQ
ncbi:Hypothetical predicted protein [Cloeon dipterum]|uniref:SCO-spondin n=3 Tax=Cloeon dipterum TaxID=197152 RepID=A0A8S1DVT7_9INSE|nr:Hypothetical predicted protein [Cloeon dipterum]